MTVHPQMRAALVVDLRPVLHPCSARRSKHPHQHRHLGTTATSMCSEGLPGIDCPVTSNLTVSSPRSKRAPFMQAVEPLDPRIHFALVCGAKSCPPIRVYTPASLEAGLEAAAQAFCSSVSPAHPEQPFDSLFCDAAFGMNPVSLFLKAGQSAKRVLIIHVV